jgi:hypothetical protein
MVKKYGLVVRNTAGANQARKIMDFGQLNLIATPIFLTMECLKHLEMKAF